MKLKLKNKEIYFAVENVWPLLDYRLRFQINALCVSNPEEEYIQEIDIKAPDFIQIMRAVNLQPQGIAKDINVEMHSKLKEQILKLAGPVLAEIQRVNDPEEKKRIRIENEELLTIADAVQNILIENATMLQNKINSGREQILN